MRIVIDFRTDSAAFSEQATDPGAEIEYVLRGVGRMLARGDLLDPGPDATVKVVDSNGNSVGTVQVIHGE